MSIAKQFELPRTDSRREIRISTPTVAVELTASRGKPEAGRVTVDVKAACKTPTRTSHFDFVGVAG